MIFKFKINTSVKIKQSINFSFYDQLLDIPGESTSLTDYDHTVTLTDLALIWLTDLVLHGSQTKQKFMTPRQRTFERVSVTVPLHWKFLWGLMEQSDWFLIRCNWCKFHIGHISNGCTFRCWTHVSGQEVRERNLLTNPKHNTVYFINLIYNKLLLILLLFYY